MDWFGEAFKAFTTNAPVAACLALGYFAWRQNQDRFGDHKERIAVLESALKDRNERIDAMSKSHLDDLKSVLPLTERMTGVMDKFASRGGA